MMRLTLFKLIDKILIYINICINKIFNGLFYLINNMNIMLVTILILFIILSGMIFFNLIMHHILFDSDVIFKF